MATGGDRGFLMGFFSSVSSVLGGGSQSKSSSSERSGFALLPTEIQDVYKNYAKDLNTQFTGGAANSMFTPLPQTDFETTALNAIQRGFTPTEETLRSDINMQMNPYDDYVIGEINRQAGGDYSLLKQAANEAGQFGSNRQMLGANDIDIARLNAIGKFKQEGFDTAVQNSLSQLTQQRAGDAALQMGAGDFLRGLDTSTRQAPVDAMRSFGELLGVLPTSGGSEGNSSSKSSSSNGIGSNIAGIASVFSDIRLKENVQHVGERDGFPLYSFNYIGQPDTTYIGVMAQDVAEIQPDAVENIDGFLAVDYGKLGFELEVA